MNAIALQRTVFDMVAEYEAKDKALADEIAAFEAAFPRLEAACTVHGTYVGSVFEGRTVGVGLNRLRKHLLKSAWKAIYVRCDIERIASAEDKRKFDMALADPPPLTVENAEATFADYLLRARFHILRGLAECFVSLDPAYKSHSKVKIGVKGLPKRVILSGFGEYRSWGRDRLRDMLNALRAVRGLPLIEYAELCDLLDYWKHWSRADEWSETKRYGNGDYAARDGKLYKLYGHKNEPGDFTVSEKTEYGAWTEVKNCEPDLELRVFSGVGTCHVIFKPAMLRTINLALAEFYGDVLPDAEEEDAKPQASTAVAKDLQFYWTPQAVVETVLDAAGIYGEDHYAYGYKRPVLRVLEPSCGDGRILDEIRARGHKGVGIEVDFGRANTCAMKSHNVMTANFLDCPPSSTFDAVVMNPPFYGRHYAKHVRHALKFIKPGGVLVSILPATAWYDHGELSDLKGSWTDLPVASFADAGTNVPTGYLVVRVKA